jgi:class 3 adenylate cyclase/TolB-like protein
MTTERSGSQDAPAGTEAANPGVAMKHVPRAVLVVDVVESVRLMERDELGFIAKWRGIVVAARDELLPRHGGRMVKHLGDGMLMAFDDVRGAAAAAFELLRQRAADGPAVLAIHLRAGLHWTEVVETDFDIFGTGVNLSARLASLARPGEVVASFQATTRLLHRVDAEFEDLGECFLKHVATPVRAFRLSPPGGVCLTRKPRSGDGWRPSKVVVLPLRSEPMDPALAGLAPSLTDDLVCAMTRTSKWSVISRLSTAALAGRALSVADAAKATGADHVVEGDLSMAHGRVNLRLRLIEAGLGQPIWEGGVACRQGEVFNGADGPLASLAAAHLYEALHARQMLACHESAFANLPSYTLLLQAVSQLHSLHCQDVDRSRQALEHLVDRHPRSPEGRAWLANWHFVQLAQRSSPEPQRDVGRARTELARALDEAPDHAFSLALAGHLQAFVDGDLDGALTTLQRAIDLGGNEPSAWLFRASALAHANRGQEAVHAIERARELSPFDPMAYCFDLFAARAYSAAGRHDVALTHAEAALRMNRLHLSTWVQLIIELVHVRRLDDAAAHARQYLAMRPNASVARYLDRHPAKGTPLAVSDAEALLAAGLPR